MSYPEFFDKIETIKVKDYLSQALGSYDDGEYEFSYLDIVKAAGHSCPTVAGAFIMTNEALKVLYPNERAIRGNIKVEFEEKLEEGVAGVVANVITHITGATDKSGFKGLQGQYARHSLMFFNAKIDSSARFTRVDTDTSVDVTYNPSTILPNPDMQKIIQKMQNGTVSSNEVKEFGVLWQDRVRRIFENIEEVIYIEEL
jgi:hypothetical protein